MINDPSEYRYVIGADIDNDHPHGDLDRVTFDGNVMPFRTGNLNCVDCNGNAIPKKNIMRGEDIAFLLEAGIERGLLAAVANPPLDYSGNAIGPSNKIPFTRKVRYNQAVKMLSLCSGANERVEWLDPAVTITPQMFAPNTEPCPSGTVDSLQDVAGISPRHVPSAVDPQQLVRDRRVLRRATIESAFAAVASRMRCVDTYGGAFCGPSSISLAGDAFYKLRYNVVGTPHYDSYNKFDGYTLATSTDTEESAPLNSSVWSMPVRPVHVGMLCELYALIYLEYTNIIRYASLDEQGEPVQGEDVTSGYITYLAKFDQQESPILMVQTIDALAPWLLGRKNAMMTELGVTRWYDGARPTPPSGTLLRGCRQSIDASVWRVYPVFTVTHTDLQESRQ